MTEIDPLLTAFLQFGLAAVLGFLIGLEREMSAEGEESIGIRDFVLFAILGAVSAFAATVYDNSWVILGGLLGLVALLVSRYWREDHADSGITTESAAALTFFLGVLVVNGYPVVAIALAILTLGILFQKPAISRFRATIRTQELQAALKFLLITFIILPVLPTGSLDRFLYVPVGSVVAVDGPRVAIEPGPEAHLGPGESVEIHDADGRVLGRVVVTELEDDRVRARAEDEGSFEVVAGAAAVRRIGPDIVATMLSALRPYKIWLIVVLVSFISLVGYVLMKLIGPGAGIGLTGLVGGLVSSTVTTLSFARRSQENPDLNRHFAAAVVLAASIMFPRLLVEIAVVDQVLMKNIALPLAVMGGTGFLLAAAHHLFGTRAKGVQHSLTLENPFSLKAAVTFGLVFAAILVVTRTATVYLGEKWLPAVAIVSGLTDADAIAFSVSDAHKAGIISTDWASFNLVLGALSNTFMKLFLVAGLGHRGLLRQLTVSFLIIGAVGIATMFLYYDL